MNYNNKKIFLYIETIPEANPRDLFVYPTNRKDAK